MSRAGLGDLDGMSDAAKKINLRMMSMLYSIWECNTRRTRNYACNLFGGSNPVASEKILSEPFQILLLLFTLTIIIIL